MQTYSNLGDVLISVAERFADADEVEKARTAYSDAMIHYDKACTMSNSDKGDDLPGLLLNWGSGLHSAGSRLKVGLPRVEHLISYTWHVQPICNAVCPGALQ